MVARAWKDYGVTELGRASLQFKNRCVGKISLCTSDPWTKT